MPEAKPGFVAQFESYPPQFWVANTMEILERMSWYGWFTVLPIYVTGMVATGGLGFSTELAGALQGIVPFFLYLMPVLTGALADRYGFKRMFIIAFLVMIVAYFLLGQFKTVPTFFMAFMFVAVGAAIFKPVVVGTVALVTDHSNSATGFGIFYMMVNIGGFFGPIVAGLVRGQGWKWVFVACSGWACLNLILVLALYKEPKGRNTKDRDHSLRKVWDNMVEVLGNARFFVTVFAVLFALMFANLNVWWFAKFTWTHCVIFIAAWLVGNFLWDLAMPPGSGDPNNEASKGRFFLFKRMHCSNWRFALFLLIMSGFWTSFNQIFYTMPEYIRDFVDTRPVILAAESVFGEGDANDPTVGVASVMATINVDERRVITEQVDKLLEAASAGTLSDEVLKKTSRKLLGTKVRLTPADLRSFLMGPDSVPNEDVKRVFDDIRSAYTTDQKLDVDMLKSKSDELTGDVHLSPEAMSEMVRTSETAKAAVLANRIIIQGRQVNPEYIVNIDAGAIMLFQVLISFLMGRFHRFTTMVIGMLVATVGIGLSMFAGTEGLVGAGGVIWIVAGGILIFSFGEMMASPTSQDYVARIAPAQKKALYMGYYFVAVALGNLFGGILKGEMMKRLAYDMNRPDLMWLAFGGIMLATAVVFLLYNKFALPRDRADTLTPG